MNALRRKSLAKALDPLEQASEIIEEVQTEEQEAYGNLPESLQNSERGETMQECADTLSELLDVLSDAQEQVENIIG